jgi:excisionase family DNA binding protein
MYTEITEQIMTVKETREALRIGHTKMYELLSSGLIRSFHIGSRRFVRSSDLDRFVDRQLTEEGFEVDDSTDGDV